MLTNEIMLNHAKYPDKVIVRKLQKYKTSLSYDTNPYIDYSRKGNMIVAGRDGHAITRNSSFFKKFFKICWTIVLKIMKNKTK